MFVEFQKFFLNGTKNYIFIGAINQVSSRKPTQKPITALKCYKEDGHELSVYVFSFYRSDSVLKSAVKLDRFKTVSERILNNFMVSTMVTEF